MFIVGILFSVLGYTLLYYGVGMASQYSDTSGKALPTAIPLPILLGIQSTPDGRFQSPIGTAPHPPFNVKNEVPNQVHPATATSPQTPATGTGKVVQV